MVKRALTLLTSILFALPLLMPFNIYGAELPQTEIIGVDYNVISYSQDVNNSGATFYNYTYEVEIKLNDNYVGVVDGTLSFNWMNQDSSTGNPTSHNSSNKRKSYVNGNSFKTNIVIQGTYSTFTGKGPLTSVSYLVDNSDTNVVKYQDLDSIETVVNFLGDIYQNSEDIENLSTNQLLELEKIVSNTSLANQYLNTISKFRQWNLPIESLGFVYEFIHKDILGFKEYNYYKYPIFSFKQNESFWSLWGNSNSQFDNVIIFGINKNVNNYNVLLNYLDISNISLIEFQPIVRNDTNNYFTIVKLVYSFGNSSNYVQFISKDNSLEIMPIYKNYLRNKNISTDFALIYGLNNRLLAGIDLIANGTAQSSSAASSNDLANEQLQTDSNTLFQQENGFKSDMNNAMQNVNNTFRLSDMGAKFVSSAQWVRTQYEQLTNNTPFASLITFSLITGLALILLGKVYK